MFMLNPKLLSEVFPINKIEVFFDAEDHSNFLGFQWEMVSQGKMPIGLNTSDTDFNSIGKTGGEKEATLTVKQIPPHYHTVLGYAGTSQWATGEIWFRAAADSDNAPKSKDTSSTGGGQPHNNMPPYIVMAFWKRIA